MKSINNKWKISESEFKGYTKAKLEAIETKLNEVIEEMKQYRQLCHHERGVIYNRINKLEKVNSYIIGFATALGFLAGLIGNWINNLLK